MAVILSLCIPLPLTRISRIQTNRFVFIRENPDHGMNRVSREKARAKVARATRGDRGRPDSPALAPPAGFPALPRFALPNHFVQVGGRPYFPRT